MYVDTYTLRPVLFSTWHCLQNNMFITNFCLHPGPFNCLRPPGLPASAESIHWALWQHAHVWLAQDFADLKLSGLEMEIQIKHGWVFENRNPGMNWDTSMITDVYGIERCHCSYSLVKRRFETTEMSQCSTILLADPPESAIELKKTWSLFEQKQTFDATPNRAHLSNSWQHLTHESHSMIGIL